MNEAGLLQAVTNLFSSEKVLVFFVCFFMQECEIGNLSVAQI